ncbi:MoxR family ATPase [Pseudanabaena sp. FACHB-1998]|uniref:AAA family ATPase n=1 Tax=Pseudanabaena sp. FACHB-1998 TaxID=2692858 RepID=UPI001680D7C6|nr:AAA family ATPase [Pseudanabaena sp. FACHB-1998]MBD2179459.1 MoxR family ATPase [Pseudanabaena sp. FACHB-1998]
MIATEIAQTNGHITALTVTPKSALAKLQQLREELKSVYLDRSEAIDLIMVGLLAKMHIFLGGKPGTGKTELAKAVSDSITGTTFFHYLMTKTTVAEEVLGAPDLAELQKGKFVRDTEAMLPEAHLALMDEIGKANSIVRNSALGLMNEREFLNGKIKLQSPLITMIGCSNELLDGEEDGAFWDRLSLRYIVDYLGDEDLRTLLLRKTGNIAAPQITTMLNLAELEQIQTAVKNVPFHAPVIDSLIDLQRELKKENFIVSTRKYVQIVTILKAYAYLQEEPEVSEDSFEILNHVIWNHPREQALIRKIVAKVGNPVNIQAQEILAAITEKLSDLGNCPTHGTKKQQDDWATEGSGVLSDMRNMIDRLQSLIAQHPNRAKKAQQAIAEIETKKKPLLAKVSEIMYGA